MTAEEIQHIFTEEILKLNWNVSPLGLYEPIGYVLSLGGKRIRPMLTLMSCDMFGGDVKKALPAALALEVFHNFTLLHDDVMDKAEMRRGRQTVHKKWNENTAILSGDVMQIKAYQFLSEVPEIHLKQVLDLFSQMACEVCEGQQYDMEFEQRMDVMEAEYLEMIRLKTAVLLATSLKIGAIIAGADKYNADLLYDFGINIGLAFQLKDDLLDVYGDEKTFGKKIGGDILCNKKTYMLITALQQAQGDDKIELLSWIDAKEFHPQEKIQTVTKLYDKLDIKSICEIKMKAFFEKSLENLNKIEIPVANKQILTNLAQSLMKREI